MIGVATRPETLYDRRMPVDSDPNKLKAKDVAELLGIPVHRVYVLVNKGRLQRYRRGGSYALGYYRRDEVERLKAELEAEAGQPE